MAGGEESFRRESTGELPRASWRAGWKRRSPSPPTRCAALIGSRGPRVTVSTACSSSANALGIAADWIRAGRADAVLCGGAESLCRMTYSGLQRAAGARPRAVPAVRSRPCRPDASARAPRSSCSRTGARRASARRAHPRRAARLRRQRRRASSDPAATRRRRRRPRDAARARRAPASPPTAIDYVNAHGTGTPLNDARRDARHQDACSATRAYARAGVARPSRRSATASAPPARSRRWRRSWRSATASCRRR